MKPLPKRTLPIEREINELLIANERVERTADRSITQIDRFLEEHRERMRDIHADGF